MLEENDTISVPPLPNPTFTPSMNPTTLIQTLVPTTLITRNSNQ